MGNDQWLMVNDKWLMINEGGASVAPHNIQCYTNIQCSTSTGSIMEGGMKVVATAMIPSIATTTRRS